MPGPTDWLPVPKDSLDPTAKPNLPVVICYHVTILKCILEKGYGTEDWIVLIHDQAQSWEKISMVTLIRFT
jgi:hypothetical protein